MKYKIIVTFEMLTEADDYEEAMAINLDCLDWSNAEIEVLEIGDDEETADA